MSEVSLATRAARPARCSRRTSVSARQTAQAGVERGGLLSKSPGLFGQAGGVGGGSGAGLRQLRLLRGEAGGLFFAAQAFGGGGLQLLIKLAQALLLSVEEAGGLVEAGLCVAAAFFKAGERSGGLCGGLLELLAFGAEAAEIGGGGFKLAVEVGALGLEGGGLIAALGDQVCTLIAGVAVAVGGEHPFL